MALFCTVISRYLVSLFRFAFLNHVHVFLHAILLVRRLGYPCSYLSSSFCFLAFVIFQLVIILSLLLLNAVINHYLLILMSSFRWYINGSPQCRWVFFLGHFLYCLFMSSFWCKAFLHCHQLSCPSVHLFILRMVPSILHGELPSHLFNLMRFLLVNLVLGSFFLWYSFLIMRILTSAALCTKILTPRRRSSVQPDLARGRFIGKRKKNTTTTLWEELRRRRESV